MQLTAELVHHIVAYSPNLKCEQKSCNDGACWNPGVLTNPDIGPRGEQCVCPYYSYGPHCEYRFSAATSTESAGTDPSIIIAITTIFAMLSVVFGAVGYLMGRKTAPPKQTEALRSASQRRNVLAKRVGTLTGFRSEGNLSDNGQMRGSRYQKSNLLGSRVGSSVQLSAREPLMTMMRNSSEGGTPLGSHRNSMHVRAPSIEKIDETV